MKTWKYFLGETVNMNLSYASTFLSVLMLFTAIAFSPMAMATSDAFHPADTSKNKIIDQEELDSYVRLWQEEDAPFIYAIRALYLVHSGGAYAWDQSLEAPECWYPFPEGEAQIQLFGPEEVVVECAESFDDPGVEAQDIDGSVLTVTPTVTLDGLPVDSVNTGFSGSGRTFQITYTAEAQTGPISVTRQVLVEDTQPPTIEPEAIQHDWQNLLVHGYREYIKDEQGNRYSFHVVNCNANWQNMDGGTALDSCIDDDPIDYWDDVEVTALRLNDNFEPELDGDNQVTLSVEEFTKHPGLYRLEYTVQDAAGNVATYDAPSYLRYVRVMDTTPVPVVAQSGLDQGQAEGRILAAGLIPVVTEEYHHGFNPGVIYSQDPAAGVFVSCGTEVHIVVVVAQALCNFPEGLQGMPLEDAKTALIEAGFLVGEVEYVDSWLDTGLVSHYSGNTEFCGSVIDLFVSAEKCELPLVVEKTPEEAIALIVDNGFAEPSVKYQWHPYPAGMVSGQFPNPGPRQCDFAVEITISMGPEPERIDLAPSLYEDFECGQDWSYLPTATVAGDQGIAAFTQATEIAYKDGEDWIVVALDTPLHTDFSLYRITYRYEFQQPDTDELGVLEVIYDSLNVVDTEPPEIFVDDDSDDGSIEIAENDFPFYILQKGQYGHWSEVEDDRNITVSAFDLCDGDIPEDDIEIWILGLDLATEDSSPLEDLGLTEDTWLNAPGYYLVIYRAEDQTGNEELSFRVVEVQD